MYCDTLQYVNKRCKFVCISNYTKQGFLRYFLHFAFPRQRKDEKKNKKNIETTIIDLKIDEEFKSKLRTGLPRTAKPGTCKNLSKNEGKLRKIEAKCI